MEASLRFSIYSKEEIMAKKIKTKKPDRRAIKRKK